MSVLLEPHKSYEEFCKWFAKEPIWHRIQIENTTCRDMGKVKKNIIGNRCTIKDIYENWYLLRHIGS